MGLAGLMRQQAHKAGAAVRAGFRGVLQSLQRGRPVQRLDGEGLAGEPLKAIELMQHFGFTSAPPAGAQIVVLPLGGRTSAAVVVATEHGAYRVQLGADGETCLYNQWGDVIHLRQDRTIHVVAAARVLMEAPVVEIHASTAMSITTPTLTVNASAGVSLDTPTVTASGDVSAAGDVADAGGSKTMAGMRGVFNAHVHAENDSGGPTDSPSTGM